MREDTRRHTDGDQIDRVPDDLANISLLPTSRSSHTDECHPAIERSFWILRDQLARNGLASFVHALHHF